MQACIAAGSYKDSISLRGLMTITPYYAVSEEARCDFIKMSQLRRALTDKQLDVYFDSRTILLSMGMSSDFEVAIEEGADIIRVGTALFGER